MTPAKYEVLGSYMRFFLVGCKPLMVVVMEGDSPGRGNEQIFNYWGTSPQKVFQVVLRGGGNGKPC